ncbi:Protein N-acetyltransferase, RimJ/RimL family [Pedobacter steynii]|uniref:Protein N-acetyltransferase, RimJ/RimL family n=1 Tax=Pedobacter steynii TaxID=430522 RepID=A0A1H0JBG7_9SPHI|nr:GNAT family N-acetyltransferase [Pedobacter steynii]NQX43091.1 GNAT family N-acetyltransferase [Pedobacter steynii]SDO41125.1 Protein N-acetyltransferase, RimJ/RimL family [Pedobacter steynii]
MNYQVYLRPLAPTDAEIAWKWRNNPKIWVYTKHRAAQPVSQETEREWIAKVIARPNERRFAICLQRSDQYIGNIQLVDIRDNNAHYHIFIGAEKFWGKGIAFLATQQMLKYAFGELNLQTVMLDVHHKNQAALALYRKTGFKQINYGNRFIDMILTRQEYQRLNPL